MQLLVSHDDSVTAQRSTHERALLLLLQVQCGVKPTIDREPMLMALHHATQPGDLPYMDSEAVGD